MENVGWIPKTNMRIIFRFLTFTFVKFKSKFNVKISSYQVSKKFKFSFQMLSCKDKFSSQVKPVSFTINDQTYTGNGMQFIMN